MVFGADNIKIEVAYSESADIFDLMDNVSNWWPGFCEEEYKKYWIKKFDASDRDKKYFKKYAEFRWRYYNDPDQAEKNPLKNRNGMFATLGSISADPVAEAFYSSDTLSESYKKLGAILKIEDLKFLKEFHNYFSKKYDLLIDESRRGFPKAIKTHRKTLAKKGINNYFSSVAKFFSVSKKFKYRVLFTWWPPIDRTNASPTGEYLVMRYNPLKHSHLDDSDIVAHEVIHSISANQSLEAKVELTKYFLEECPIQGKIQKGKILEEPLAVVFGQLIFSEIFFPKRFSLSGNLYNNAWINAFSKVIYEPVSHHYKNKRKFSKTLMKKLGKICKDTLITNPL